MEARTQHSLMKIQNLKGFGKVQEEWSENGNKKKRGIPNSHLEPWEKNTVLNGKGYRGSRILRENLVVRARR